MLKSTKYFLYGLGFDLVPTKDDDVDRSDALWRLYTTREPGLVQEMKARFVAKNAWPELKIDKDKIDANIELAEKHDVGFLLTIWWGDTIKGDDFAWARFIDREDALTFRVHDNWGRNVERDDFDKDCVYLIPITSFDIKIPMKYDRLPSKNGTRTH